MGMNLKTRLTEAFDEKIANRKAMFIPMLGVMTFMLVGYAAVDHEKPEIVSDRVEISYGEKFDADLLEITDNHDDRDDITVEVKDQSLDIHQLGSYKVDVIAIDRFNNECIKTIDVDVVDNVAPVIETLGADNGYIIEVPINGSSDLSSYIKAVDNVDGDITPFIESDKNLDASVSGMQEIQITVSDIAGNKTEETLNFLVADIESPTVTLKAGRDVTVDYKSEFKVEDYMTMTDNVDTHLQVEVKGKVDTSVLDDKQNITVIVKDAAGNKTTQKLNTIIKDISGPQIVLSTNKVRINKGDSINLASYLISAQDNSDGDMKSKVTYNTIDTSSTGTKTVTYTATDSFGNKSAVQLQVEVVYPGQAIVNTGLSKLGTPYKWGSTGPTSFDCSGFTQWVYRQNGIYIPRTSGAQKSAGKVISLSQLEPGDIVWRSGHVGIYIGGGKYVHAPHTGDVVKVSSMSSGKFTCGVRYR
ncbi:MAG: C40 family peptidase [Faecalibacillus sp.]